MNHNTQGVSRNGNQGRSGQTQLEPATGSKSLGSFRQNAPTLGAGATATTRFSHDKAAGDHRSRPVGGQASRPGFFGIRLAGTTDSNVLTPATRLATFASAAHEQHHTEEDDQRDFLCRVSGNMDAEMTTMSIED